jgi:hypothetical protein
MNKAARTTAARCFPLAIRLGILLHRSRIQDELSARSGPLALAADCFLILRGIKARPDNCGEC